MHNGLLERLRAVPAGAHLDDGLRGEVLRALEALPDKRERLTALLQRSHTELEKLVEARSRELDDINARLREEMEKRKAAEAERERMRSQVVQMQKMEAIGTLAGGVAHDFNNLLTVIRGHADLMAVRMERDNDPGCATELAAIRDAARRAGGLTRQLLMFSRNQPCEPVVLNVNTVIEDLVKMLGRLIGEDIRIQLDLERGLRTVRFDPVHLDQVVTNLAVNARDAMPGGGVLSVRTRTTVLDADDCASRRSLEPGTYVRLEVEDTGCGMDRDTRERIFEPFYTTKERGKGSGIGLSVVYGIVRQHKGWIDVVSSPGNGTAFILYLPAAGRNDRPEVRPEERLETFCGKGERILLVEDEEGVRDLTVRGLQRYGYRVAAAANEYEAARIFEHEGGCFDLVLCDVVLKNSTGIRLVERFQERSAGLRVLFTSGYADKRARYRYINSLRYPFVAKPYTLCGLLQAVHGVLSVPQAQAAPQARDGSVLVVGDDTAVGDTLRELLDGIFTVTSAGTGREAVGAAERERFAVILLDRSLPDIDGMDVLARIRRMHPRQQVVMLMDGPGTRDVVGAMRAGARTCIGKPVCFDEAVVEIRQAAIAARAVPELERRDELLRVLRACRGKQMQAAEQLRVPVESLIRKIREFGIGPDEMRLQNRKEADGSTIT